MSVMSQLDLDRQLLDAVSIAVQEPVLTAEEQIERKLDWLIREANELIAMTRNPETVDLVDGQRVAVGMLITRVQLIGAFLMECRPAPKPKLRVVHTATRPIVRRSSQTQQLETEDSAT